MAKVEIYTKFLCPYCTRAKKLLAGKGIEVDEHDISMGGPLRAEMLERSGGRMTVPHAVRICVTAPSDAAQVERGLFVIAELLKSGPSPGSPIV